MAEKTTTTARLRKLRMSPRKVRLLIDLIRGLKAETAAVQLAFSKQVAAKPVLKLLRSAVANARHNHHMNEQSLVIAQAYVDSGAIMYRSTPRAMGRATPIRKRTAHVTIVLEGEKDEKGKT